MASEHPCAFTGGQPWVSVGTPPPPPPLSAPSAPQTRDNINKTRTKTGQQL